MRIIRPLVLYCVGGLLYLMCEILARGFTHWTMFFVGGLCFLAVGAINEVLPWEMPFVLQCFIGSLIVTAIEFVSGCIINIWLGWNVWDYSGLPFNLLGQICLQFWFLWLWVCIPVIIMDDYIRYWSGEEKPHYYIWRVRNGSKNV